MISHSFWIDELPQYCIDYCTYLQKYPFGYQLFKGQKYFHRKQSSLSNPLTSIMVYPSKYTLKFVSGWDRKGVRILDDLVCNSNHEIKTQNEFR